MAKNIDDRLGERPVSRSAVDANKKRLIEEVRAYRRVTLSVRRIERRTRGAGSLGWSLVEPTVLSHMLMRHEQFPAVVLLKR
jgi:hypothetical protein